MPATVSKMNNFGTPKSLSKTSEDFRETQAVQRRRRISSVMVRDRKAGFLPHNIKITMMRREQAANQRRMTNSAINGREP
jgi:hypothetical protein